MYMPVGPNDAKALSLRSGFTWMWYTLPVEGGNALNMGDFIQVGKKRIRVRHIGYHVEAKRRIGIIGV